MSNHKILLPLIVMMWFLAISVQAQGPTEKEKKTIFNISKGTFLTGFSIDWTKASRDNFNFEFERAFTRISGRIEGLYFLNDRIGLGPILGYQYLFRDLENNPGVIIVPALDTREWNFEYGAQAGWYAPINELFGSESIGNSHLFFNGGVSWLRRTFRTEGFPKSGGINKVRFGYQIATGLLIPLGNKIALETRLQWEARERRFVGEIRDVNGNVIRTFDETKWPSVLSLGIGFKVGL